MKLFGKTRLKLGNRSLRKKVSMITRTVSYSGFDNVRSIGVVWDTNNPNDFKSIAAFHSKMGQRGIKVKVIGYSEMKVLPSEFTAIQYFTCLRKEDIDYLFRPISPESEAFINENFDVLIDINFKKVFPLFYISSMSRGGIKAGLLGNDNSLTFDLMIEKENPSVGEYLDYIVQYLEMINNKAI